MSGSCVSDLTLVDPELTRGIFGANIVASEGEEWKKYRKIVAPAFSEVCPEPFVA
jgi:cytochrome P450